ncbi:MAG: hypothetical protein J6B93_01330 [Clostridia bacterium]|nr:hypothetical protein [Clostridia bacterium]
MYRCLDCKGEFSFVKIDFERHGLDTPPFERRSLCPYCESDNIIYDTEPHCRYCGSRLREKKDYCSAHCRRRDYICRQMDEKRRKYLADSPLTAAIKEVESYNKEHGTRLTYGQYFALKDGGYI